jgi:hypothetical protein
MRKLILAGVATALTLALASRATAEEAREPDVYVVYVDEAALRAEPSDDAEVSGVLTRSTRVKNLSEVVTEVEGRYWRQVKAGDAVGWVADADVIPAYFYDPFEEADERGRAGDAEGMVVAAVKGFCAVYDAEMQPLTNYGLAPDGLKIIVDLGRNRVMPSTWSEMYGSGFAREPVPVMFFAAGRGLARYAQIYGFNAGEWFPDSRYFVYPKGLYTVGLLNVDTWEQLDLGLVYWRDGGWDHEIIGEYLVWLGYERPENPPARRPEIETPVLMAYDVSTGETLRLLEADLATIKDRDKRFNTGYNWYEYYEIKMVPAAAVPAPLRRSKLYEKYNGAYALARESWA